MAYPVGDRKKKPKRQAREPQVWIVECRAPSALTWRPIRSYLDYHFARVMCGDLNRTNYAAGKYRVSRYVRSSK